MGALEQGNNTRSKDSESVAARTMTSAYNSVRVGGPRPPM